MFTDPTRVKRFQFHTWETTVNCNLALLSICRKTATSLKKLQKLTENVATIWDRLFDTFKYTFNIVYLSSYFSLVTKTSSRDVDTWQVAWNAISNCIFRFNFAHKSAFEFINLKGLKDIVILKEKHL